MSTLKLRGVTVMAYLASTTMPTRSASISYSQMTQRGYLMGTSSWRLM